MSDAEQSQSTAVAERAQARPPIPLYNGVLSPDRWALFGRIAQTVAKTDFVPKGMRGSAESVMACLLYGDSLGIHPSVALKEIYIVDGKPGISGALMLAKIRQAGHRISFTTLRGEGGEYKGTLCKGKRMLYKLVDGEPVGEVDEEDEWQFTMEDAKRAGLVPPTNDKAAWAKYPETMCRWRALSQVARFLFSDVFAGGAVYTPDEVEEAAYSDRVNRNGAPADGTGTSVPDEADYGDDPDLAAWLIALFAAANTIEPGRYLSKKVKLLLKDKTQDERGALAVEIASWIQEQGVEPPRKPTAEEEPEAVDGVVVDDEHPPLDESGAPYDPDLTLPV